MAPKTNHHILVYHVLVITVCPNYPGVVSQPTYRILKRVQYYQRQESKNTIFQFTTSLYRILCYHIQESVSNIMGPSLQRTILLCHSVSLPCVLLYRVPSLECRFRVTLYRVIESHESRHHPSQAYNAFSFRRLAARQGVLAVLCTLTRELRLHRYDDAELCRRAEVLPEGMAPVW